VERLDIINFCDAAGEWGSILPIPAHEAERMVELADRRKIADLDEPHVQQPRYKDGEELRDRMQPRPGYRGESLHRRQSRSEDREELLDPRLSRFEPHSLCLTKRGGHYKRSGSRNVRTGMDYIILGCGEATSTFRLMEGSLQRIREGGVECLLPMTGNTSR
jgi:hypothetical protein